MSDELRPINPKTREPMPVRLQPGYYPGFETLSQQKYWDAKTREVVLERVHKVPAIRFFTELEARLVTAICDRILPQDERDPARRIPILPRIDDRLFSNRLDGYRFEDMPTDQEAYRLGMQAIEEISMLLHSRAFIELLPLEQDRIVKSLHDRKPAAALEIWKKIPVYRFWALLVQDCVEAYYAHPWAWDEVGFGGPAYPRGYMRLERGEPEPWEVEEQRYEWEAPPNSSSDHSEAMGEAEEHLPPQGQGGTH